MGRYVSASRYPYTYTKSILMSLACLAKCKIVTIREEYLIMEVLDIYLVQLHTKFWKLRGWYGHKQAIYIGW